MKEYVNLIHIDTEALRVLSKDSDTVIDGDDATFIERKSIYGGSGFRIDATLFKLNDKLYKFATIRYLKEEESFTVPFEVFHKSETRTLDFYTNWIDDDEK